MAVGFPPRFTQSVEQVYALMRKGILQKTEKYQPEIDNLHEPIKKLIDQIQKEN
jgi:hypothetical protein